MATLSKSKTRASADTPAALAEVSPEQRRHYVEVAAYYIAEHRGFVESADLDDWLRAETEVDRMLAHGRIAGG